MRRQEPIYQAIVDHIREQVHAGEIQEGASIPSRKELATKFNTAKATIDRAIRELMQEGYLEARAGSGTYVRKRRLPAGLKVICIVSSAPAGVVDVTNNYFGPLLHGICEAARLAGCHLAFEQAPDLRALERLATSGKYAGLIILRPSEQDLPVLESLQKKGIHFVAVPAAFEQPSLPCIAPDNVAGARLAIEHLIGLGHTKIGVACLSFHIPDHYLRIQGYQEALSQANLTIDPGWLLLGQEERVERFRPLMKRWLQGIRLPTAIFCTDFNAVTVLTSLLSESGIRVPEEISVVGFDDPPSAVLFNPPITTVHFSVEDLGHRAFARLLEAAESNVPLGSELLPVQLVIRESTAAPREPLSGAEKQGSS